MSSSDPASESLLEDLDSSHPSDDPNPSVSEQFFTANYKRKTDLSKQKNCVLCSTHHLSGSTTQPSSIHMANQIRNIMQNNLSKYMTSKDFYNVKVVNDVIYNEQTHIVSVFKDYLILDDISEFLKRFYDHDETTGRLPRIYEFYEKYSRVFPNYVSIPENKYMFKNIERKQRMIDEKQ